MLRAGFIGFGRMGITHFSILNTHPDVKIVAICDPSKSTRTILKKYLNIGIFSNYQEMIDKISLDFVVISTPTDSHAEIIAYAINNGLHTFSEKPLALTAIEGREILNQLYNKNLVNQIGYVNRFNEVFMAVKKIIATGIIGEVKNFQSEMYGATVLKEPASGWRAKRKTGGGCLYEFASHCIDLVVYLLGQPDKIMGSIMQRIYSSDSEDLVSSNFVYKYGYSGSIMVNWSDETFRKPTNIITIFGNKGKIVADKHAYKIFLKEPIHENGFHKGWNTRYITDFGKSVRFYVRGNEFTRQLDYFVDCIANRRTENISSFADAYKTDVVMEEIVNDANLLSNSQSQRVESNYIIPNNSKKE